MSVKQFKFVSPGVFVNEIDNSFLPDTGRPQGPAIIGRTERGPGLRPVKVDSMSKFVNLFGNPIPGGFANDVWRYGNYTSPTYAAYAAQAWLRNSSPAVVVRLLGAEHPDATSAGYAGWKTTNQYDGTSAGGAYGLFLIPSGSTSVAQATQTGSLAAVWYCDKGYVALSGTLGASPLGVTTSAISASMGDFYKFTSGANFKAVVNDGTSDVLVTDFNFTAGNSKFIRKVFNTNPTLCSSVAAATSSYFLGETFENWIFDTQGGHTIDSTDDLFAVILPLKSAQAAGADMSDQQVGVTAAQSDWIFSQDLGDNVTSFDAQTSTKNLFKFHALNSGQWESQNVKVSIEDIRAGTSDDDPYGSFNVVIRRAKTVTRVSSILRGSPIVT